MKTGQAVSHQPQVVHAHTVSDDSTPPSAAASGLKGSSFPSAVFSTTLPSSFFETFERTFSWSHRKCLSDWLTPLCVSGLPVMYVGQCVWQRPHSVQVSTSRPCFQVRSVSTLAPNSSFSRLGVDSFADELMPGRSTGGSAFRKTLPRPTMTWKCFPCGRKFRNTRMMVT